MEALTDSQAAALEQLQALTNGADMEVSIAVLQTVNWDVQQAADVIFGGQPSTSTSSEHAPMLAAQDEGMEMQAREEWGQPARRERIQNSGTGRPNTLFTVLTYPLQFISSLLRFVFNILRIPVPAVLLRFSSLNYYRTFTMGSGRSTDPRTAAERWVRSLEEETGALVISQARAQYASFSSASGAEPGPSNASHRRPDGIDGLDGRRVLPDFILSGYEAVLQSCIRESRIGCIILVSEEHDDAPAFKRNTLTDPKFVELLTNNNVAVWGADVRDREGWSASQKLQATTYPFVAFVAPQPRRGASASSSSLASPVLAVLSRHQGSSSPPTGQDAGPTSPAVLAEHLTRQVVPRVQPFLDRIKASHRERERERELRREQDRAFEESARRDKERIERKMAEERRERDEKARGEAQARAEAERAAREEEEEIRRAEERLAWRRYARRALIPPEAAAGAQGSVRIALRLPEGRRLVRAFAVDDSLTGLFSFIDAQFVPAHLAPDEDPSSPPSGSATGEVGIAARIGVEDSAEWWGFRVASSYPRKEIVWMPGTRLADVDGFKDGGQLIVETVVSPSSKRPSLEGRETADIDDDGYESEE